MDDNATNDAIATDNEDSVDAAIENYDLSGEGQISEQSTEDNNSFDDEDTDDNPDKDSNVDESEEDAQEQSNDGEMTEEERREHNRQHAEQRIRARQEQEDADRLFKQSLREQIQSDFVGELDESVYEEIAEQEGESVAEMRRQLDELAIRERQREADTKLAELESVQANIGMELAYAQSNIPMFNPNDPSYNEELLNEAQRSWAKENALTHTDEQGNVFIVGVKDGAPSPYQYLTEKSNFYSQLMKNSATKGQEAAMRNLGRTEIQSSGAPVASSGNSLKALEDRIGDISLA